MLEERAILDSATVVYTIMLAAAPPVGKTGDAWAQPGEVSKLMDQEQRGLLVLAATTGRLARGRRGRLGTVARQSPPWGTINRFHQVHLRLRGVRRDACPASARSHSALTDAAEMSPEYKIYAPRCTECFATRIAASCTSYNAAPSRRNVKACIGCAALSRTAVRIRRRSSSVRA